MLVEYRPDAILRHTGHALLFALQDAGLMGKGVQPVSVRVAEKSDGYEVSLEDASRRRRRLHPFVPPDLRAGARPAVSDPTQRTPPPESRLEIHLDSLPPLLPPVRGLPTRVPPRPRRPRHPQGERPSLLPLLQRYVGGGTFVYTRTAEGRRCCLVPTLRDVPKPETWHSKSEVNDMLYTIHATTIQAMTSVRASQSERLARIWRSLVR